MNFRICTIRRFPAAHQLRLYDGSLEPLHRHDWQVKVTVSGPLDAIGVVMDFHDLERRLDAVLAAWHDRTLNEVEDFRELNPSAENVAFVIARRLRLPPGVDLRSVEVWETPGNSAVYGSD